MTQTPTDVVSAAQSSAVVIRRGSARPAEPKRAAARFAALITADLVAFATLRELYRLIGEGEALGHTIAAPIQGLLPAGYLDGWQYAFALVLGLFVTGNYGAATGGAIRPVSSSAPPTNARTSRAAPPSPRAATEPQ